MSSVLWVLLLGLSRAEEGDLYRSVPVLDCSGQGSEGYGGLVFLSKQVVWFRWRCVVAVEECVFSGWAAWGKGWVDRSASVASGFEISRRGSARSTERRRRVDVPAVSAVNCSGAASRRKSATALAQPS